MAKQFYRNTREPALGVGIRTSRSDGRQTFQFASGEQTYKDAYCELYIKPAPAPAKPARAVRKKVARPKPAAPSRAEHPDLEQQILAQRTDGAYAVYADWLQNKRDPRGELIVAQQLGASDRARQLLAEHTTYFVPEPLAKVLAMPKRGTNPRCDVVWRSGFIEELHLAKDITPSWEDIDLVAIARATCAHPSAKFLRKIVLGAPGGHPWSYVDQLTALGSPSVEELVIGEAKPEHMEVAWAKAGDLVPAILALPRLKKLVVKAGSLRFGKRLTHPALEEVQIETGPLASKELDALFAGSLPALHTLSIACGGVELGEPSLKKLGANKAMPELRHLTLRGTKKSRAIVDALTDAAWTRKLETLVLDRNDLDSAAATEAAEKLAYVRVLEIGSAPVSRFALTEQQVMKRSPDRASMDVARKLADPASWYRLGYDPVQRRIWGGYVGGDRYDVWLELERLITGCDCASPKYPCKHALALALLVARGHPFEDAPMPPRVRHTTIRRSNYGAS